MALEIVDLPIKRTLLIFHSYGKEGMVRWPGKGFTFEYNRGYWDWMGI